MFHGNRGAKFPSFPNKSHKQIPLPSVNIYTNTSGDFMLMLFLFLFYFFNYSVTGDFRRIRTTKGI